MKVARFITSFIGYLIIYSFVGLLIDMLFNNDYNQLTYAIRRIIQLLLHLIFIIYVTATNDISLSYKVKPRNMILYVIILFAFIFLYESTIDALIDRYFVPDIGSQHRDSSIHMLFDYPAAMFIQACISAPLLEEVLVRGVFYEILRKRLSIVWSVIITSIFFTVMHFDSFNTLFYIMISIIFSYVYVRTGSITYCVILHMCVNSFSFLSYYIGFLQDTSIITIISLLIVIATLVYIAKSSLIKLNNSP